MSALTRIEPSATGSLRLAKGLRGEFKSGQNRTEEAIREKFGLEVPPCPWADCQDCAEKILTEELLPLGTAPDIPGKNPPIQQERAEPTGQRRQQEDRADLPDQHHGARILGMKETETEISQSGCG